MRLLWLYCAVRAPSLARSLSITISSCAEEANLVSSYSYSAELQMPAEVQFKSGCGSVRKRNEAETQKVAEKRFPL